MSETDDDTTVETTCTSGSWLVNSSAVATSFTRNMIRGVEVAGDLSGLGGRADAGFQVRPGLRVRRYLKPRPARLVEQRDGLVADQLVELVGVDHDVPRRDPAGRAAAAAESKLLTNSGAASDSPR